MAKSTEYPGWPKIDDNGGYTVQPVPGPTPSRKATNKNTNEEGNNQKLKLLSLGKAISGAPHIKGTNQFPKPAINTGITEKKIITTA